PRAAVGELFTPPRLPEIEAPGQLADHHEVRPLDDLAPQGRCVDEHREALGGPEVGEEVQLLPEAQQPALRPALLWLLVPLRTPHRAEQDGVALLAELERRVAQRLARRVDRAAADQGGLELEGGAGRLSDDLEHLLRFGRDLESDTVSG